ncbi:unnamed protein product [Gemmataceae bacterium]|nr:unnamed protein product [Gemmataceae bacterium]VTU02492.1 unnamed protein product [Gemmataceae bacterium]
MEVCCELPGILAPVCPCKAVPKGLTRSAARHPNSSTSDGPASCRSWASFAANHWPKSRNSAPVTGGMPDSTRWTISAIHRNASSTVGNRPPVLQLDSRW